MKRIIDIVEYVTACVNAISKGVKVVSDNWPDSSPFMDQSKEVSNGDKK